MSPDFCASGIWTGVAPGDSSVLQGIDKVIGGIQLVAGLVWRVLNSVNFCLSVNFLISLSNLNEILAG